MSALPSSSAIRTGRFHAQVGELEVRFLDRHKKDAHAPLKFFALIYAWRGSGIPPQFFSLN